MPHSFACFRTAVCGTCLVTAAVSAMPDHKSGAAGNLRLEQALVEPDRPLYVKALNVFLKAFFVVYDAIVFIPFKIFADPEQKVRRSQRKKVSRTRSTQPSL